MGTNFYAIKNEEARGPKTIHIGKRSAGYLFAINDCNEFHSFPELARWLNCSVDYWENYKIFDEYDQELTVNEMIKIIEDCQTEENKQNPNNFVHNCKDIDGYRFCYDEDWC